MGATPPPAPEPVVEKKKPVKKSEAGGLSGFLAPSPTPAVVKAPAAPPPAPEPVVEKKKSSSKSFGGLFSSSPKSPLETTPTVSLKKTATKASINAPASMNAAFQQSISRKLKNDRRKIQTFQKATDAYRAGSSKPENFLAEIEALFGAVELESVIGPLCSELPEVDKSKMLKTTYQRLYKQSSGNSGRGGLFSGFFGSSKSSDVSEKKVTSSGARSSNPQRSTPSKASTPSSISKKPPIVKKNTPTAKAAAPVVKVNAFSNVKVPAAVPIGKQVVVRQRIQSYQGGSLNTRDFYNFLVKNLGQQTTADALPGIYATLSSTKSKEPTDCSDCPFSVLEHVGNLFVYFTLNYVTV